MALLARIKDRLDRRRGALAVAPTEADAGESPIPRPAPTAGTAKLVAPPPTAGTRRLDPVGETAGTQVHRIPHGTPSTQRIHNPTRPGR